MAETSLHLAGYSGREEQTSILSPPSTQTREPVMKHRTLSCTLLLPLLLLFAVATAKTQSFSVEAYKTFLEQSKGLTPEGIEEMHSAGLFSEEAPSAFSDAVYADSIDNVYDLTEDEKLLIARHGFMVTERITLPSFGDALHNIYINDLPIYVSSDMILHALHKSYDAILMDAEESLLIPRLREVLEGISDQVGTMKGKYQGEEKIEQALADLDLYTTVALRLLTGDQSQAPVFSENNDLIAQLQESIVGESPASYPLFGEKPRLIDFSQFTVRGHYTQSEELSRYFQAMIWLGRTELFLSEQKGAVGGPSPEDIERQTLQAALIHEALSAGDIDEKRGEIERLLGFMVGESDNVSPDNLGELFGELGVQDARDLLSEGAIERFQNALATKSYAGQRILSQILFTDPTSPDKITPPSAFLLFGQRFVIDSYVLSNVVYDKVAVPEKRMLPSSLDVLFALGNDAALQLLRPELDRYQYASQLASLRYLIDSYDESFWSQTLYAGWLGAIRELNPPANRENLPAFMQTAAWWQKKMNTQLASWAQLRHDNLLYAKQSYSGGVGCSYPKGYVEPVPAFYQAIARYAERGEEIFREMGIDRSANHFRNLADVSGTLEEIARKELAHEPLTEEEKTFFSTTLSQSTIGCGEIIYNGWYPSLFFSNDDVGEADFLVADVHTAPTDAAGNMVGWVMHAATGRVNMAVITCRDPEGQTTAYIGPVMSYHEHITTNFKRLTDQEWASGMRDNAYNDRPSFTNLYLADANGEMKGAGPSLRTGVSSVELSLMPPVQELVTRAHPNPLLTETTVVVEIPQTLHTNDLVVTIYNDRGEQIAELFRGPTPSGHLFIKWDGNDSNGNQVPSGTYLYRAETTGASTTAEITVLR